MADEVHHVRIEIRDINGVEKTSDAPPNLCGSATAFRIWADLQVYGDLRATGYCQATKHFLMRFVPHGDDLTHTETKLHDGPGQRRVHAILRAEIGWSGPAGVLALFHDDQWPNIRTVATRITISPGERDHRLLVELPLKEAGPQVGPQDGQEDDPQSGPQYGPQSGPQSGSLAGTLCGPLFCPLSSPPFGPRSDPLFPLSNYDLLSGLLIGPLYGPLSDPQSGSLSDPSSGP